MLLGTLACSRQHCCCSTYVVRRTYVCIKQALAFSALYFHTCCLTILAQSLGFSYISRNTWTTYIKKLKWLFQNVSEKRNCRLIILFFRYIAGPNWKKILEINLKLSNLSCKQVLYKKFYYYHLVHYQKWLLPCWKTKYEISF